MAKSKNHTAHNQSYKAHRNGIKKPKKNKYTSRKGVSILSVVFPFFTWSCCLALRFNVRCSALLPPECFFISFPWSRLSGLLTCWAAASCYKSFFEILAARLLFSLFRYLLFTDGPEVPEESKVCEEAQQSSRGRGYRVGVNEWWTDEKQCSLRDIAVACFAAFFIYFETLHEEFEILWYRVLPVLRLRWAVFEMNFFCTCPIIGACYRIIL